MVSSPCSDTADIVSRATYMRCGRSPSWINTPLTDIDDTVFFHSFLDITETYITDTISNTTQLISLHLYVCVFVYACVCVCEYVCEYVCGTGMCMGMSMGMGMCLYM